MNLDKNWIKNHYFVADLLTMNPFVITKSLARRIQALSAG